MVRLCDPLFLKLYKLDLVHRLDDLRELLIYHLFKQVIQEEGPTFELLQLVVERTLEDDHAVGILLVEQDKLAPKELVLEFDVALLSIVSVELVMKLVLAIGRQLFG